MKPIRLLTAAIMFFCLTPANVSAQATPTDVYQKVRRIAAEADLIRLEMGIADAAQPEIKISGAQTREVYYQALTLFEKSNRLLFEQLRERADTPVRITDGSNPADVLILVDNALELVLRVKQSLGIEELATVAAPDDDRTPSDVYQLLVRLNRKLNALLQQQFTPADIYQQITYGVGLASSILATITPVDRLGHEPELVRRKTPGDVYRKLLAIYTSTLDTIRLSGEQCLGVEAAEFERDDVSSSDVYDLASLLVSELNYLHDLTPGAAPPRDSYYPGDKLPAQVFQRAGRLESQVEVLRSYASAHPAWLKDR